MKVTIMIYGFVKVTTGYEGCVTENYYFATERERDSIAMQVIANEDDCKIYDFEYEKEVEV